MTGTATEVVMCGRTIKLGDKLRIKYKDGSGYLDGIVTELWSPEKDKLLQGRIGNGWCFHNQDTIVDE